MSVVVSVELQQQLETNGPVVAFETAVLTSGLPKCPWNETYGNPPSDVDDTLPVNLAVAIEMTKIVHKYGATPAWISVVNGDLIIGTTQEQLEDLSKDAQATKVSLSNIAQVMHAKQIAGTTVAATLLACSRSHLTHPIRVFATGGIGGMHQHWNKHFDVSADLNALATTQTCVVTSGAKSILDLPSTVEALETIGVPLLGIQCDRFPRFVEQCNQNDPVIRSVQNEIEVAKICQIHWNELQMPSAVITNVPVPKELGLKRDSLHQHIAEAEKSWHELNLPPNTRTPFILEHLAVHTKGNSLRANIALLLQNAKKAAKISCALSDLME